MMKGYSDGSPPGLLLALVDEAFEQRAWHGPTLRGSIRGVPAAVAEWRPGPGRHTIREIVLHAAYWKYAVRRRLTGDARGSFARAGSNWFRASSTTRWADDVRLLVKEHRRLREAVARLAPRDLGRRIGRRDTVAFTIRGIAAHDLYHAGQIQLIKRLARAGRGG
jgi:DinB family protein